MAVWNFKVDDELDKKAFEAAHDLRMSKSEFVREAVQEKIDLLYVKPRPIMKRVRAGDQVIAFEKIGYIPPTKEYLKESKKK